MKKLFTIGEVSKFSYISTHTLRYYDKIGLLQPRTVGKDNQYRYYTYEDFLFLDTIKYLKKMGMSLGDIKEHFGKRSIETTLELYRRQLVEAERQIEELSDIRNHINRNIDYLNKGKTLPLNNEPEMIKYGQRYAIISTGDENSDDDRGTPFDKETQYKMLICGVAEQLYRENLRTMGNDISIKSKQDLLNGEFNKSIAVGNMLIQKPSNGDFEEISAGEYACIYHIGASSSISESYKKLMKYVQNLNYEIIGDCFELFLVDSIDTAIDSEYVTHIQIPVKKLHKKG